MNLTATITRTQTVEIDLSDHADTPQEALDYCEDIDVHPDLWWEEVNVEVIDADGNKLGWHGVVLQ
tara:strand:- start:90 stop:287 length:198 start_codon:yes stop_codon:yes gene_type:complete